MSEVKVISLEQIKERAKGTVLEIPDWIPGKTIYVRVRAIDVTPHLMKAGTIPNELKAVAVEAFEGKDGTKVVEDMSNSELASNISKLMPVLDAIVEEALVEPKYSEVQKVYPLTLAQKMAIFNFVLSEVEDLKPFRKESK